MQKLTFALFLVPVIGFCQTRFEKGYFVGNDGVRVDCLIKNEDWKNNPTQFDYKEGESGEVKRQLESLKYSREDLRKFFLEFNKCTGALATNYTQVDLKREKLHITLRPGLDMSSYQVYTPGLFSVVYSDFSRSANFRLGVEFEYFLQTNRNRWSFFVEPTYRSFVQEYQRGALVDKITYTSIEVPLGARYNAYFGESSKLFFSAAWVLDFPFSSEVVIQNVRTADIYSSNNFAFGVGYARKKISAEVRLFTSRNLQNDYVGIVNEFNCTSFIIGYRLY